MVDFVCLFLVVDCECLVVVCWKLVVLLLMVGEWLGECVCDGGLLLVLV